MLQTVLRSPVEAAPTPSMEQQPVRTIEDAYAAHADQVLAFLRYRMLSRADAEDLTQLTFERALRAWDRFDPARASARTWLLAIARNLLIDQHRRATTAPRPNPLDPDELAQVAEAGNDLERILGVDPDLATALAELSRREREVIALRFGGGLENPEIAELCGLSLANTQQIVSRALRKLRRLLDGMAQPMPEGFEELSGRPPGGTGPTAG